jgi:uridine kinase
MVLLVAIVGGSGSGKTTLARRLVERLHPIAATLASEDSYYHDHGAQPGFDPARYDFDDLGARDHDLLAAHLRALKRGKTVQAPRYSFDIHRREGAGEPVTPGPVAILEGLHLLCTPAVAECFDLTVFLDAPADIRFIRRLLRDQAERGRTAASVVDQYLGTVRAAHERWVEPGRFAADLVVEDRTYAIEAPSVAALDAMIDPILAHPALARLTETPSAPGRA